MILKTSSTENEEEFVPGAFLGWGCSSTAGEAGIGDSGVEDEDEGEAGGLKAVVRRRAAIV